MAQWICLPMLVFSILFPNFVFANPTGGDELTAFRLAKLFYAARAAVGEQTAFTDDPTNSKLSREDLIKAIRVAYKRLANEDLNEKKDPEVNVLWKSINIVISNARKGS